MKPASEHPLVAKEARGAQKAVVYVSSYSAGSVQVLVAEWASAWMSLLCGARSVVFLFHTRSLNAARGDGTD